MKTWTIHKQSISNTNTSGPCKTNVYFPIRCILSKKNLDGSVGEIFIAIVFFLYLYFLFSKSFVIVVLLFSLNVPYRLSLSIMFSLNAFHLCFLGIFASWCSSFLPVTINISWLFYVILSLFHSSKVSCPHDYNCNVGLVNWTNS